MTVSQREEQRLTLQHRILVMCQGGLCPPEAEELVRNLLAPTGDGPQPQVVDIGSGSGIWFVPSPSPFPPKSCPTRLLIPLTFVSHYLVISIRAVEMAQKFPHVKVIGIDLAESKPA